MKNKTTTKKTIMYNATCKAHWKINSKPNLTTYSLQTLIQRSSALLLLVLCLWLLSGAEAQAQNNVGIGTTTPNSKAILELRAVDKGFLAPRLTTLQMNAIAPNATESGLLIYNIDSSCYHFYNGTAWKNLCDKSLDTSTINKLIRNYVANTTFASITSDTGNFEVVNIGGVNVLNTIADSVKALAWLLNGNNNATSMSKLGTRNAVNLHIVTNNNERMSIMSATGNVGIGQTLPSEKLDVAGAIKLDKELKPGGLAGNLGDLLVSGGSGTFPTWVSPTTIVPTTTVSNTLTGTNLTTTVNGITGAPVDLSTIAPTTTVSNTYNTTTGALNTTVNGVTGANITLPTNTAIADSVRSLAWLLRGNNAIVGDYLGTNNNVDVVFKRNGVQSGVLNTSLACTSFGFAALNPLSTGINNVALGNEALLKNTTGNHNAAIGVHALQQNTIGDFNTALGIQALLNNIDGQYNSATGSQALISNTSGQGNTANGHRALFGNGVGNNNSAAGASALQANISDYNSAMGASALQFNTTGNKNAAFGRYAGYTNTIGNNNTFLGTDADASLNNLTNATAIGYNAIVGASNSMVLGGIGTDAVNVGIGLINPSLSKLYVKGVGSNTENNGLRIESPNATQALDILPGFALTNGTVSGIQEDNTMTFRSSGFTSGNFAFANGNEEHMRLTTAGYLGIGTTSPTSKLEIVGDIKIVDGTQGFGKILTSDGAGKASWQTPVSSNVVVGTLPPGQSTFATVVGNNDTYSGVQLALTEGVWEIEYQNWGFIATVPTVGFFYTALSTSSTSIISPVSFSNNKTCLTMPYFDGNLTPSSTTRVISGKWMITVPSGGQIIYIWNGIFLGVNTVYYKNNDPGAAGPYSYCWAKKII
jgi:hypothetical protein